MTKSTKWHVRPAKRHSPSLIRVFAVCMKKAWVLTVGENDRVLTVGENDRPSVSF